MDEITITITQAEYKELHEIAVRYKILKEIHSSDKYISKEDSALYNINLKSESED